MGIRAPVSTASIIPSLQSGSAVDGAGRLQREGVCQTSTTRPSTGRSSRASSRLEPLCGSSVPSRPCHAPPGMGRRAATGAAGCDARNRWAASTLGVREGDGTLVGALVGPALDWTRPRCADRHVAHGPGNPGGMPVCAQLTWSGSRRLSRSCDAASMTMPAAPGLFGVRSTS